MSENLNFEEIKKRTTELKDEVAKLNNFSPKLDQLLLSINHLISRDSQHIVSQIKELTDRVESLESQLVLKGMPGINKYEHNLTKIKETIISDDWPLATPANTIPQTEEDKLVRAETILDLIVTEYLDDTRFLDAGCGEGHVATCATKRNAKKCVGYDIVKNWKMPNTEKLTFTTNWDCVKENGPYDIILFYDVIDHIQGDPVQSLHELKNILSSSGKIYLRAHPWCSRHGGHLYDKINKAFLHLILDDSELLRLFGISSQPIIKLTHPIDTYHKWFHAVGLVVKEESLVTQKVEDIFLEPSPAIRERLDRNEIDYTNMSIQYVDYILEPHESNQQVL